MKRQIVAVLLILWYFPARSDDVFVRNINGAVTIRHGVTQSWVRLNVGDVLRQDDTIRTGKDATAVIVAPPKGHAGTAKTIVLPSDVIVDISDIRDLTQEELMLKLTMEKVRASSYRWKSDGLKIPESTVIHGSEKSDPLPISENELREGVWQLNGTRVLFNNGYYSTCALKALEVLRRYPSLALRFESRLLVAEALEKAELRGEALAEYGALASLEGATAEQKQLVQMKIAILRKQAGN
jgi:hypothetical protein